MQTEPRVDVRQANLRLAVAAALVALVIPVVSFYGPLGGRFVYSLGGPRVLVEFLLGRCSSAIVLTMGILFLRRGDLGIAGGTFAAVALYGTLLVAEGILGIAPHFGRWWPADVVIGMEIAETILVAVVAARAIGASRTE